MAPNIPKPKPNHMNIISELSLQVETLLLQLALKEAETSANEILIKELRTSLDFKKVYNELLLDYNKYLRQKLRNGKGNKQRSESYPPSLKFQLV